MNLTWNTAELDRIKQTLRDIAEKGARKHIRTGGRKAMQIVRDTAFNDAPVETGKLKANVLIRTSFKRDTLLVRVGVKGGAQKNETSPYYWRMVEFGTQHMPARPFMAPALETNAQNVLNTFISEMVASIARAARRQA